MKIPDVLLLGNGLNRAFGASSWDKFLAELSIVKMSDKAVEELKVPSAFKAIYVTDDSIDVRLKEVMKNDDNRKKLYEFDKSERDDLLKEIIKLGFSDILTTNYSYELEKLCYENLSDYKLRKIMRTTKTGKKCESKYLLHTYNELVFGDNKTKLWHIHGEERKPDSMILGFYYYIMLINQITKLNERWLRYYDIAR